MLCRDWQKDQKCNTLLMLHMLNGSACCMSVKHTLQGSWLSFDVWMMICLYPSKREQVIFLCDFFNFVSLLGSPAVRFKDMN